MARQKLSKIASELNVGLSTVREFLQKKNIEVEDNVNARVDDDVCQLLIKEFGTGKEINLGPKTKTASSAPEAAKTPASAPATTPAAAAKSENGPKVLGKIDLSTGKPVIEKAPAAKPEEKPAPKPEAPKNAEPAKSEPKAQAEPAKPEAPKPEPKPAAPAPAPKAEPKPAAAEAAPKQEPVAKPKQPKAEPKPAAPAPKPEPKPAPKTSVPKDRKSVV